MNAKVLIFVALIVAAVAAWFFHKQESVAPKINIEPSEVDYEATDIKAVQTNDEGDTEYELNADSLTHNPTTNEDEMSGITMNWAPGTEQRYRIEAGSAAINQQTGELRLSGGFLLSSKGLPDSNNSSSSAATPITITGQTLMGNTKERAVYSNDPVKVVQGDNRFEAASMKANLEAGEYEFGQISITFMPPERQDAKLF